MQRQLARGLTWTIIQTWGGQLLSLLVFVILARLVRPDDFGLIALAAVFVSLAQLVVDQGLGDALVQRREIGREHVDTAFWVAILTGSAITVAGLLLAEPIALVLGEPDLAPVLRVLSITFVLSAFSSIPIALLTRQLAFRLLAIRTLLSIVGGGVVGIALAYADFGVWALVAQQVTAAALSSVMLWAVTDWRPRFSLSTREFGDLFGFGVRVVGSDFLGFVTRNADNFLIGVFLGTVPLGLYAVGYRILDTSQRLLINVARKVTFPAFARLQHDRPRLSNAYIRVSRTANVLVFPGYIGLAALGEEFTVVLFGHKWAESGSVASILFLSGPVLGLQAFSSSILYASGHPEIVLRFRVISTAVNVAAFAIALPFGILAVAAAFTLRAYLFVPLLLLWTERYAGVRTATYLRQLRGLGGATVGMGLIVVAVKAVLHQSVGAAATLAIATPIGVVSFAILLWLLDRRLLNEVWVVVSHAVPGIATLSRRLGLSSADDRAVHQSHP